MRGNFVELYTPSLSSSIIILFLVMHIHYFRYMHLYSIYLFNCAHFVKNLVHTLYMYMYMCSAVCHRAKLHQNAALVQVPIGLEADHKGIVDIIRNKAIYFTGEYG